MQHARQQLEDARRDCEWLAALSEAECRSQAAAIIATMSKVTDSVRRLACEPDREGCLACLETIAQLREADRQRKYDAAVGLIEQLLRA